MGFGYLFLGYLVTFLLHTVAGALGVGSLAMLVGCLLMWLGLKTLRLYCSGFVLAEWSLYSLLALSGYRLAEELSQMFLWSTSVFDNAETVMAWVEFALIMVFHAALLSALREIGMQVELQKISTAAIRNMILVSLYAVLYAWYWIPNLIGDTAKGYLTLSITLLNLGWIICNLWLLLTCAKDIVAEGQEEIEPKRYKWEFLNRIGDRFEENMKRAAESNRDAIEDHLRKKRGQQSDAASQSAPKHTKKKKKK